jgi:phosphohistidine phosphatase
MASLPAARVPSRPILEPPVKRLLLLRHAKSDWSDHDLADHDRPLAPRGERAAALVAAYLEQRGSRADVVLCSTARRTRQTLERVLGALASEPRVETVRALYLAEENEILALVRGLDDTAESALVVGHNPGIGALAADLAGSGDPEGLERLGERFPTCALADLVFEVKRWRELAPGAARLEAFATPKDLV